MADRNPFYSVADLLGVNCADRTDEVIAGNMADALRYWWMKLPSDYDAQPVRPGEAVNVSTSYGFDDWVFAKVKGVSEYNHVLLDVPGYDYPQDVNAHCVREAPAVDDYGNELEEDKRCYAPELDLQIKVLQGCFDVATKRTLTLERFARELLAAYEKADANEYRTGEVTHSPRYHELRGMAKALGLLRSDAE
ncbi:MAG: hypothetical protein IJ087_01555 [Eggerthellaceae bacterium]|nr:hypothetical protein [Eggerthellaceae bacterium]